MRKNAGFNNKKDLIRFLLDGGECWYKNFRVYYSENTAGVPFRCGGGSLRIYWDFFDDMEIKVETSWHDQLDGAKENAIICWVSRSTSIERTLVKLVMYRSILSGYKSIEGYWYRFATPVSPENLYQGE